MTINGQCGLCGVHITNQEKLKSCPLCGGKFIKEIKENACK